MSTTSNPVDKSMVPLKDLPPGYIPNDITKRVIGVGRKNHTHDYRKDTKITFQFKTSHTDDADKVIDDSRKMKKPMELILGKQFKLEIWEVLLKSMGLNEVAEFKVPKKYVGMYPILSKTLRDAEQPQGHSSHSCCGMMNKGCGYHDLDHLFAAPEDLTFTFEILNIENPGDYSQESWQLTLEQKLASVPVLKESGNDKFKCGDISGAKSDYFLALSRIEQLALSEKPGSPEFHAFEEMKIPLLLNYGFCLIKEGEYYEAIQHLSTVIQLHPNNAKALFRRAKCHQEIGNFNEAEDDYNAAALADYSLKKSVNEELKILQKDKKIKDERDKNIYNKLFE